MMRWLALVVVSAGVLVVACVSDAVDTTCPEYCSFVTAECKDADAQYVLKPGTTDQMPACLAICMHFPPARTAGSNSIACRKTAASSASEIKDMKAHHARCMDAGPFSEMCGGTVANFCRVEQALCPGSPFATEAACAAALPMVMKDAFDTMGINDLGVPDQSSKLCRFYHVEKALEDPGLHCPHTNSPVSPICLN